MRGATLATAIAGLAITSACGDGDRAETPTRATTPNTSLDASSSSSGADASTVAHATTGADEDSADATTATTSQETTSGLSPDLGDSSTGEASGTSTGDAGDTGTEGSTAGGEPPPPGLPVCVAVAQPCPGSNDDNLVRHGGLVSGDRCQFELEDQGTWANNAAILDAIANTVPEFDISTVIADTNRVGAAVTAAEPALSKLVGLHQAFKWDATDTSVLHWMPQGMSGSWDAAPDGLVGGRQVVAVSWYHKPEETDTPGLNKGVRVAFADVTDLDEGAVPYRHVLLVEPFMDGNQPSYRAIKIHAGGIAWTGRYLYVTDTVKGLRVFDTARLLKMTNLEDRVGYSAETQQYHGYGYTYVLPQVGAYYLSDPSCWHRFSSVSFDRTSNPPSLITGEYYAEHIAAKVIRWPLDGEAMLGSADAPTSVHPMEVFFHQEKIIQGAASSNGRWWLSAGAQLNMSAVLFRTGEDAPSDAFPWVFGPEDLMYVHGQDIPSGGSPRRTARTSMRSPTSSSCS